MPPTTQDPLQFLLTPTMLYFVALLGMFMHFLKKKVNGETLTAISGYFRDNVKSTFLAWGATSVAFAGYMTGMASGQKADIVAVFGIGFGIDSILNKWDPPSGTGGA